MPNDEVFNDMSAGGGGELIALRIVVEGKVQNVGLREWIKQKATSFELDGWVRNRMNDTVEALFVGPEDNVREVVKLCHQGPTFCYIKRIKEFPQADTEGVPKGFTLLPTV